MTDVQTLSDLLDTPHAAAQEIAYFTSPKTAFRVSTVSELRERALLRLGAMLAAGAAAGDEVVMPIADPALFLETFWASILGGFIPMPLAPPINDSSASKILDILASRASAHLVIEDASFERLERAALEGGNPPGTSPDARLEDRRLVIGQGADATPAPREPSDIAFIQYSSGSTRAPKGVIVRHAQALANLAAIVEGANLAPEDRTLSWMPLSHDMGLVGFHLAPLFAGAHQAIMPTSAFARSPMLWLKNATELRSTILSSPNFGYRHALKAIQRKGVPDGIDLAAVRLIMNGAEPISVELSAEFLDALNESGLRRSSILPVYGLAEATLAVTFPALGSEIRGLRLDRSTLGLGATVAESTDDAALVACGCGRPLPGLEVRIAGGDGGTLPDDTVGRVWIRGAGVTEGYYDDVAATAEAIQGEGWLDTGDLGFLRDGELYITGRLKDLVIVDGQNFYPHDLEDSLQRALDLDALRVAVAPVRRPGGTEEVGVFVQHRGEAETFLETATAVRKHLSETFGLGVELVVPVGQIPRTTSGKVQRIALGNRLVAGDFDEALAVTAPDRIVPDQQAAAEVEGAAAESAAESATGSATGDTSPEALEVMMSGFCAEVLDGLRFGPTDNLFEQGMSSIDLAEIHGLIEARYPKGLDIRDFFDQPTIRGLAAILSERVRSGAAAAPLG